MGSPFTTKSLAFLRGLARNNDREWFRARTADYDQHVRGPMIAVLERLAADFATFAPELVSEPKVSLFRIYRDTRFSEDKSPLKTQVAAHFPARGFPKGEGAGLYFEVAPRWVWMGGGLYKPSTTHLAAIREHIAAHHRELHRVVTAKPFRAAVGGLDGAQLTRVPRGYPADHAGAQYLRYKQFLGARECPASFAIDEDFYPTLLQTFRAVLPLVRFLNAPLLKRPRQF